MQPKHFEQEMRLQKSRQFYLDICVTNQSKEFMGPSIFVPILEAVKVIVINFENEMGFRGFYNNH